MSRGNRGGRPSSWNAAAAELIVKALSQGVSWTGACRLAGVSESTARGWRTTGESHEQQLAKLREEPEFPRDLGDFERPARTSAELRFAVRVRQALGAVEAQAVDTLMNAVAEGDVAAAKFLLTSRFGREWREQTELAVSDGDGGPVRIRLVIPGVSPEPEEVADGQ